MHFSHSSRIVRNALALASCVMVVHVGAFAQEVAPQAAPAVPPIGLLSRKGETRLLEGLPEGWQYTNPVLSPDGKRIALLGAPVRPPGTPPTTPPANYQVVIYTLPSGPATQIDAGRYATSVSWIPGSGDIAIIRRNRPGDTVTSLVAKSASGSGPERELLTLPLIMTSATWFPDGKRAVIAHAGTPRAQDAQLFMFSVDQPDSLKPLFADNLQYTRPALNADGTLLAFVAAERALTATGGLARTSDRVFVLRLSDGQRVQVATGNNASSAPSWSSTGNDLYYQTITTNPLLYRARVRPGGRNLDIDNPVLVAEYRMDTGGSSFAVLPGDSLFAIRLPRATAAVPDVPAAIRGKRAGTADQRRIEQAAATAVMDLALQQGITFENFVHDTRVYGQSGDGHFAGFVDTTKSFVLPSRIGGHVNSMSRIFKAAGVIEDDTQRCVVTRPAPCRMGSHQGIVAFTPAVVSVDSARISVIRAERGLAASANAAPTTFITWRIILDRKGSEWVVRTVTRVP